MSTALSIKDLSINYGSTSVVKNLNFTIKQNTATFLIGNNGSGKSTFLRTISSLHKEYTGEIEIYNKSIVTYDSLFKKGFVAYLAQNHEINFDIIVLDLLLMGRYRFKKIFENYSEEDVVRVKNLLQSMQINHLLNKKFKEISGGEQQLILFAQAILQEADLYLLDEPTQNLDIKNSKLIFEQINDLITDGKTVICTTHDLHMLNEFNGNLLNFSKEKPSLENITKESIELNSIYLSKH